MATRVFSSWEIAILCNEALENITKEKSLRTEREIQAILDEDKKRRQKKANARWRKLSPWFALSSPPLTEEEANHIFKTEPIFPFSRSAWYLVNRYPYSEVEGKICRLRTLALARESTHDDITLDTKEWNLIHFWAKAWTPEEANRCTVFSIRD